MKHYSIASMTDAEENAWMLIVNDEAWNNDIADTSALDIYEASELVRVMLMNGLRRKMNVEYCTVSVRNSLIYLHVLHNQDSIDYAHSSLIDKYVDCSSEDIFEAKPKIGDTVTHTAHSHGRLVGVITGERRAESNRWKLRYTTGKTGSWLKKYTVLYDRTKDDNASFLASCDFQNKNEQANNPIVVEDNAIINSEPLRCQFLTLIEWEKAHWDWKVKQGSRLFPNDSSHYETMEKYLKAKVDWYREHYPKTDIRWTAQYYNPTEEITMQAELLVTKVNGKTTSTKINGMELSTMNDDQIIGYISKAEKKVDELKEIKVDSTAVKREIKRLNKFVKDVATLLDAKK